MRVSVEIKCQTAAGSAHRLALPVLRRTSATPPRASRAIISPTAAENAIFRARHDIDSPGVGLTRDIAVYRRYVRSGDAEYFQRETPIIVIARGGHDGTGERNAGV